MGDDCEVGGDEGEGPDRVRRVSEVREGEVAWEGRGKKGKEGKFGSQYKTHNNGYLKPYVNEAHICKPKLSITRVNTDIIARDKEVYRE